MSSDGCSVEVVTDPAAFLRLEPVWNETVERAGIRHPFLRHEWLSTWWECFGTGRHLHIMMVRSGDTVLAIAPLMSETDRMYGVPVRRIGLLHNDHTPRADFIVAERPEYSYRAIWNALLNQRERWDVLQLNQLPRESATREAMSRLASSRGCATGIWPSGESPYLEVTQNWQEYFGRRTSKFRQNLRNRLTRLTELGEPVLEALSDGAAIQRARDEAFRLEASGWKNDAGTAICSDPTVHRFYHVLADRAAACGWLRLLFLSVNGQRIATSYASHYQGRLFLFKTGYDPRYAKCSPFKLLTYFALQDAFRSGLTEVDFLGDSEPWKLEWTTTRRPHDWLFVFSGTCRARVLHPVKFRVVPAMKRFCGRSSRVSVFSHS